MRTVRFELEVEVDEGTVDLCDGDEVAAAEEILFAAPAFDSAEDIKADLRPVADRRLIVQERVPAHDGPAAGEEFVQEWHFDVVNDVAYFRELQQQGETYRSADLSTHVRDTVRSMGYRTLEQS